jgi:hypothetical protein
MRGQIKKHGEAKRQKCNLPAIATIALPSVLTVIILAVSMKLRVAPQIEIEAVVRRLTLTRASLKPAVAIKPMAARAITLRGLEEWRVHVSSVEAAKTGRYDARTGRYAASSWSKLKGGLVALKPSMGLRSKVRLEAVADGKPIVLDRLYTGAGAITYEVTEKERLFVELSRQPLHGSITLPDLVRVQSDLYTRFHDPEWPWSEKAVTLQIRPVNAPSEFVVKDLPLSIVMSLGMSASPSTLMADVSVSAVGLVDQAYGGEAESTLSGVGKIRFVGFPDSLTVPLEPRIFVEIGGLQQFYVRDLTLVDNAQLRLNLSGVVEKLCVGPKGAVTDRRPSWFQALRFNPTAATVFAMLSWVIPTVLAARKYLRGKS